MIDQSDQPTHTAHTAEQYRILLLERQLDHVLAFIAPGLGRERDVHEIGTAYREQRREFPLSCEPQPGQETELDVDDVLREAENALDQAGLAMDPHAVTGSVAIVDSIVTRAKLRVRQLLDQRGVTE